MATAHSLSYTLALNPYYDLAREDFVEKPHRLITAIIVFASVFALIWIATYSAPKIVLPEKLSSSIQAVFDCASGASPLRV